jgi:hypothetical protein
LVAIDIAGQLLVLIPLCHHHHPKYPPDLFIAKKDDFGVKNFIVWSITFSKAILVLT